MLKPERVDIRLAATDALPPGDLPVMLRCPMKEKHNDSTRSLAVYSGNIHCFGCGFHIGRRYEALAYVLGLWSGYGDGYMAAMSARDVAHKYTIENLDAYRDRAADMAAKKPLNNAIAKGYYANGWGYARIDRMNALSQERGLKQWMMAQANIGYDTTRYTIPIYNREGGLISIRYRRDDFYGTVDAWTGRDKPKYEGTPGYNGTFLYPQNLVEPRKYMVVVEGEFDALRLLQSGVQAMTVTNGAGQVKKFFDLYDAAFPDRPLSIIHIATDMDAPGQQAAVELSIEAERRGVDWDRWYWSEGKDITEFLLTHTLEEVELGHWCLLDR